MGCVCPVCVFFDSTKMTAGSDTERRGTVDPMAVTWMEKYSGTMEKVWSRIPNFLGSFIATVAVFLLGATLRGEWLLVLVHIIKQMGYGTTDNTHMENITFSWSEFDLASLRLQGLQYYFIGASSISYLMYLGIGGFLHWYFYVRLRDRSKEWKCQPEKFMSPDLERHEIMVGSFSLLIGSTVSAIIACYVMNGGWTMFYYQLDEYTWFWWFLQWPAIFIYQDYLTYVAHRLYHTPFLYKNFHKLHHKYKQPTAFSVTALHPVEFLSIQCIYLSPMFLFPIHWFPYCVIALYTYYHGIIDHSGINFKAQWWQPWQPDCIFHDNHHQYFHVNFGFNIQIWDKLHGTYRQKDRIYTEEIFYGKGKELKEATDEEIQKDLRERESENPLAYRNNQHEFKLDEADVKKHR